MIPNLLPMTPAVSFAVQDCYLGEDLQSTILLPLEFEAFIPVEIWPDGNCLASCLSLLQYGYQTRSMEMRVRLVIELVSQWGLYLDYMFITRGFQCNDKDYINNITMYCDDGETSEIRFKKHIFNSRINGKYLGIFHIAAAASVLKRPVFSVYPLYGGHTVQGDIHRLFLPRVSEHKDQVYIMWTNTTGVDVEPKEWRPNHFTVLFPKAK